MKVKNGEELLMNGCIALSCFHSFIPGAFYRAQLVQLTFGYRKRNQKKIRRMRRQGVEGV